jgi:hypothetical protein
MRSKGRLTRESSAQPSLPENNLTVLLANVFNCGAKSTREERFHAPSTQKIKVQCDIRVACLLFRPFNCCIARSCHLTCENANFAFVCFSVCVHTLL